MKQVLTSERLPIKLWLDDLEKGALRQAKNLANLPFAFKHIAIMPDSHQGYGMPIGGVFASQDVVIPNAVGVDIGCGMCAMQTSLSKISPDTLKSIFGAPQKNTGIRARIPVGKVHHQKSQEWEGFDRAPKLPIIQSNLRAAQKQLGTLGGGNHFIEVQKGSDGHIWVMIHSGSRNFGYQIAKTYNALAQSLCQKWYAAIPKYSGEDGLAFLPLDTAEGQEYVTAMQYALEFAKANRLAMMRAIQEEFLNIVDCSFAPIINIHHNYAALEKHFDKEVLVHRKGATSAKKGETGIIPGSQGTKSYIVSGRGNPESFQSCSHGAGRALSRTQAQKKLKLAEEQARLDAQGIVHGLRETRDLDEAAGAYKDIDVVMANQEDLVRIDIELTPLGVIKG